MLLRVAGVPFCRMLDRGERSALLLREIVERRWVWWCQWRREVDAGNVIPIPLANVGADARSPVAALCPIALVTEPAHQRYPGGGDAFDAPAPLRWLIAEAVAWKGRTHDVEGVRRLAAVRGRVGERPNDLEELDHRAGPAVGDDQRERAGVGRAYVDEVDSKPIYLCDELRHGVQATLTSPPVVLLGPVAAEVLHVATRHALNQPSTVASSGHRARLRRSRRSRSSASGTSIRNGVTRSDIRILLVARESELVAPRRFSQPGVVHGGSAHGAHGTLSQRSRRACPQLQSTSTSICATTTPRADGTRATPHNRGTLTTTPAGLDRSKQAARRLPLSGHPGRATALAPRR
jgi:hypothetical protein